MRLEDTTRMNIDLADILEGEARIDINKDVAKKGNSSMYFKNWTQLLV